jgi:ABC-type sugar transport system substrate-binding protein
VRASTAIRTAACMLLSVGLVAGCARTESGSGGNPVVGVDFPRSDSDFWNSYIKYVPQFARSGGIDLKTTNSANDIAKLAANVQSFISQGVKGVVIAPQDTAAVAPALAQLKSKNIPVVSVDTRPDTGDVYMVVRADNRAYGEKACTFLGEKLEGKGKVVEFEGDLASINGRDRTEAFGECMKQKYPGIRVFAEATNWKGDVAASKLQTVLAANPDINGIYMQAGGVFLAPTIQVLRQKKLLLPAGDPRHVAIVSNDGIPEELKAIQSGQIDATVSQPADLYAKYALSYIQAAIQGKTFQPGPTDHNSTIIKVREGALEDQLAAPLVTADGARVGDIQAVKADDKQLWGNQI